MDLYSIAVDTIKLKGDESLSEWCYFPSWSRQNKRLSAVREASTVSNSAAGEPKMTHFGLSGGHPPRVGGGVSAPWCNSAFIQKILV